MCEEITAAWACRKPQNCPYPNCQLACEQVLTCEYTGPDPWPQKSSFSWLALWIVYGVIALIFIGSGFIGL